MICVREERPEDRAAVASVNRAAFGGEEEALLVERLWADGQVAASLVAEADGAVVGHILFSPLEAGGLRATALAPMAVLPAWQRRGVGSLLVRHGLQVCLERGYAVAVVVGHPRYYPRFGFSAELARHLRAPFQGEAFMALELVPGALAGHTAAIRYAAAFGV